MSFSSWSRRNLRSWGFNPLAEEVGLKPAGGIRVLFHDLQVAAIQLAAFALVLSLPVLFTVSSELAAQERTQVHSFHFRKVELRAALDSLLRWYAVPLIYLDKDVAGKWVNVECDDCTFEEALRKVTEGHGLVWKTVGEQMLLQKFQKVEASEVVSNATFAGTVRNSLTGEAVIGADILLFRGSTEPATIGDEPAKVHRWCSTNQFGFFSLRNIEPGNYVLHIRRLGYQPLDVQVSIPTRSAVVRDFVVFEQQIVHPEITVEGRRSAFSASEGISQGVYIRAMSSDPNQYFLEGARIYNPLHFGGVMSTFNGDALRDVQMIAGGVPPYYGGRIGGVLDVVLRDGAEKGLRGSAAVGSLGSYLLLEGPAPILSGTAPIDSESASKRTTFVISGRRGYPDIFFPRYQAEETPSDLNSSELMVKLTHRLSQNQRLTLSGYYGRDTYDNHTANQRGDQPRNDTFQGQLSNSLRWGNAAANLRWIGVLSPSLFFSASAIYTRYGFDVEHRLQGISGGVPETFLSDYLIEDAAVRAHAEYFYDEYHTVLAGVELMRHRMAGRISEFSSQVAPMSFDPVDGGSEADGFSPWELSVYLQDQWRLAPSVLAEVGARATSFIAKQGSFSSIDPRFSLLVSLRDDLRLYSSLSAVNQFVHPYRHSGIFLFYPSIFFYPSTDKIRPSTSLQVSLGMEKNFHGDRYRLAVESYYRTTQKLHEFVYDTTAATTLSDALLLGEGNVYGAEVTLDKRLGTITGSIRYSFTLATNRFAELNGGEPFRPRFDRRHELYGTISYSPQENWTIGAVCLLSSNQFPSFTASGLGAEKVFATDEVRTGVEAQSQYPEPYDLNGGRLPGFQRLELYVQRTFSWRNLPLQATLRLLNGYGMVDPFIWELRQNPDNRLRWQATFDAPPLFPLYPVASVGVRF